MNRLTHTARSCKTAGRCALVVGALLAAAAPLFAHHSSAPLYDVKKEVTIKGTITEYVWTNPHVAIEVDAVDDKGTVRHWHLEHYSPPLLERRGWTKTTLRAGDQVTLTFRPGRNGVSIGFVTKLVLADGRELK
jgi:uncharacterized protein DUF6152